MRHAGTTLLLVGRRVTPLRSPRILRETSSDCNALSQHHTPQLGAFSGLAKLSKLNLDSNQISSIEPGDFSGLTNLALLYLGANQISSIEPGDFSELTNLTFLDLSANRLTSIKSGTFSGLPNLNCLGLAENQLSSIEAGDFDGLVNLVELAMYRNQISSIDSGAFRGLTKLQMLYLHGNRLSSIEAGAFTELKNLNIPQLYHNVALTELNLAGASVLSLFTFRVDGNTGITSVSLKNAVLNQESLTVLLDGGQPWTRHVAGQVRTISAVGIGELNGVTKMDLSGVNFGKITDLKPLYVMDDLTELWLVNTKNLDASGLDLLLDNLATIEGTATEGVLYMTQADFDTLNKRGGGLLAAWDAEPGHHVEIVT